MSLGLLAAGIFLTAMPGIEAQVRLDERAPYFRVESSVLVGNKGEEHIDVSMPAECGNEQWVFDHAEIAVRRNRYGGAQITQLPARGCQRCEPIVVRWFHEPTGFIAFDVNVYRRRERTEC